MPKPYNMFYLLFSILSSAFIIVLFKLIGRHKVDTLSTIIINYPVACIAGFFLTNNFSINSYNHSIEWLTISFFLGILFIVMFWFIGTSSQKAGISVTTVAAKMSVVIPITYSIYIDDNDHFTFIKALGIGLAVVGVLMSVFRKENRAIKLSVMVFPLIIFVGLGLLDSIVKYAQLNLLNQQNIPLFTATSFGFAFIAGLLIIPFSKTVQLNLMQAKTWLHGIPLGLLNFGSMYFLIKALAHIDSGNIIPMDSSIIFGINNISIVAVNILIGFSFFKERPANLNWIGFFLSLLAISILAIS